MLKLVGPMRIFGYTTVLLLALSLVYAAYISVKYWSGIAV
jgi:hypothetical protein